MDVGHILSNFPPIVENIFKHLITFDLNSCAQVCSLWKTTAEIEKSRREREYACLFFRVWSRTYIQKMDSNVIQEDEQLREQKGLKAQFCLVFASDYYVNDFDKLYAFHLDMRHPAEFEIPPKDELAQKRNCTKTVIQTALKQLAPDKCKTMLIVAPGVIGSESDFIPGKTEENYGFSGVMFPFIHGLRIFNFPVDPNNCDISELIPKGIDIKCLLVFAAPHESCHYKSIISSCVSRQKHRLAVGGVLIPGVEPEGGNIVAFCGESVEAASIAIETNVLRLEGDDREAYIDREITSKLELFQDTGLLKHKCFAFMFTSATLGHSFHEKYLLESSIFQKLYPEVPLIGVYGYAQIAHNYLPNISYKTNGLYKQFNGFEVRPLWYKGSYVTNNPTVIVLISLKI